MKTLLLASAGAVIALATAVPAYGQEVSPPTGQAAVVWRHVVSDASTALRTVVAAQRGVD